MAAWYAMQLRIDHSGLYDLTEPQPSSDFDIGRAIVLSRRASGVKQDWPMPWELGGSGTWPGWLLTEVPLATEVPPGTSAPDWLGKRAKQPRGVLKMSTGATSTTRRPWPPKRQVVLAREGKYSIGLAIRYTWPPPPAQKGRFPRYRRERELVVGGGGQKARLEIRLKGGHPAPNPARLSKAGKGRPDQVVFTGVDNWRGEGYAITLEAGPTPTAPFWKDHPNGHTFTVKEGETVGPFWLDPEAPVGLKPAYSLKGPEPLADGTHPQGRRDYHPPEMFIDP